MSHTNHQTIDRIFAHPTSHNIHWRDVIALFGELGGRCEETKHDHLKVFLSGKEMSFKVPHGGKNTLDDDHEIAVIRKFLKECGFGPNGTK